VVQVEITIEQKHHAWSIVACKADFGKDIVRLVSPTRTFTSQEAAVNFVKRMVLRDLRHRGRPETGTDIKSQVKIRSFR